MRPVGDRCTFACPRAHHESGVGGSLERYVVAHTA